MSNQGEFRPTAPGGHRSHSRDKNGAHVSLRAPVPEVSETHGRLTPRSRRRNQQSPVARGKWFLYPLERHPALKSLDFVAWGSVLVCTDRGRFTPPVWVDHVGSQGTRYVTGDIVTAPLTAPNGPRLPQILRLEQGKPSVAWRSPLKGMKDLP